MKYIIFFLFLTLGIYAQNDNIYVEYKVTLFDDGTFTTNKMFAYDFINAAKEADKLVFGLLINSSSSKFYQVDSGIENSFEMTAAKSFANYSGTIYNINGEKIRQSELLGKDIYVNENQSEDWVLTTETKDIGGYLCYKATNTYTVVNPKRTVKFPLVAWYCPQLPYNYGPLGYGNLPGLILELQVRYIDYHLEKIDLNSKKSFNTDFLKKATIVTIEELNKRIDIFNNFEEK